MKNNLKKWMLLSGMLCMMGFSVYGCGNAQNVGEEDQQENIGEMASANDAEGDISALESDEDMNEDISASGVQAQDTNSAPQGTADKEEEEADETGSKPSGDSTAASWDNSTPDLEGNIKEINGTQVTVIEAYQEKDESGAEIMVGPSVDGDDSDFNKVTVTYDDKTLFSIKTIYGGGTSYETAEAAAADMEKGQLIEVWGSTQDGELKAEHIRIVEVK